MKRQPSIDDRVIIAWYSPDGAPDTHVWDFHRLPLGSGARAARVAEYERFKEALTGQGCQVHTWDPGYFQRYRDAFWSGKLCRIKHQENANG